MSFRPFRGVTKEMLLSVAAGLSGADRTGATPQGGLNNPDGTPAETVMQQLQALLRTGGVPSVSNLAGLKALPVPSGGTMRLVLAHTTASDGGGGLFRFDSASSAADDNGLTIAPNAGTGRWLRVTNGGITPYMFGGLPAESNTNATAAVQKCVDAAKGSYSALGGSFRLWVDLAGKSWRVSSVNATLVQQPGLTIGNGALYGTTAGKIVLDCTGTNRLRLFDLLVYGDRTTPPAVGILLARGMINGAFPGAPHARLTDVTINGYFAKAAFVNFASEVLECKGLEVSNWHRSLGAFSVIVTGHAGTFDQYVLGLASEFATIPQAADGAQSCILHDLGQVRCLRSADLNLPVLGITNANPAVVSVDPASLQARGLTDGQRVYFYDVSGMTQLNQNSYAVANVNLAAGTFELSGTDSTAFGTFVSGRVQNQTGAALLVASCSAVKMRASYLLSYGTEPVRVDLERGGVHDLEIDAQTEHQPPQGLRIDLPTSGVGNMRRPKIRLLAASQKFRNAVMSGFDLGGVRAGTLRVDGMKLDIVNMSASPASGIFGSPGKWTLRGFKAHLPLGAAMNSAGSFGGITGEVFEADTNVTARYGTVTQR
jgi:hypothetical protein